jgi:putative transposase
MQSAEELGESIGVQAACAALIVPRSSLYRARTRRPERTVPKSSPRAFSEAEKIKVRQELNSDRFQDQAPREVYATLMDEGHYLCSWRSMYRILAENDEVRERRDQLRHPNYVKPELLATAPNQLWSWDTPALAAQVQVSPNCWVPQNGPTTICMSFWMCLAVMWLAG